MSKPLRAPRTPCVGICSTGIGDDVCRGCKRFAQEVIDWNGYSWDERQAVLDRLDQLLSQVVRSKFELFDRDLLLEQLRFQQVAFKEEKNPYCWIFDLLRHGAGQITNLADFGIRLKAEWQDVPLAEMKNRIDQDFYQLSCAYYERYIVPGQLAIKT